MTPHRKYRQSINDKIEILHSDRSSRILLSGGDFTERALINGEKSE